MEGDENVLKRSKGGRQIKFDIVIPTPKGDIYCVYFKRLTEVANVAAGAKPKLPINLVHKILGHPDEDKTRKTAKMIGIKLIQGGLDSCDAFAAVKENQKNVPKVSSLVLSVNNAERVFLDTATIKKPEEGPQVQKPNWHLIVDERTKIKISNFFETKDGMVEPTCKLFEKWQKQGKPMKFI